MENKPAADDAELLVKVFGMGTDGRPFFQNVHARNLTSDSALLAGIDRPLSPGDIIGVQLGDKKARCRVLNAFDAGLVQKIQAQVELLVGQACPWEQHVIKSAQPSMGGGHLPPSFPSNKRKFSRHRVPFPVEIRDERGSSAPMQTSATDISGRGCYVETLVPLPLGTKLTITFWLDSKKILTPALVRTSDPGVGMGIEFIGLDPATQTRLQQHVQEIDPQSAGASGLKAKL